MLPLVPFRTLTGVCKACYTCLRLPGKAMENQMNKICVLGLGYIGLPTAALAAKNGHYVVGVDVDPMVVKNLSSGSAHFDEPGLNDILARVLNDGTLTVRTSPCRSDVFMIAVPTPINEDKTSDLRFVKSAVESIVPVVERGNLVIVESTIPPGTTEEHVAPILAKSGLEVGRDIFLAYCPERVLPGRIIHELSNNDRIIGGVGRESAMRARDFYRSYVRGSLVMATAKTAEMVKLVENAYRDVNIAFANELSMACNQLGVNVWDVIEFANRHPRVNILNPGPGVGGHCIAVDPWFLVERVPEATSLIATARQINDSMPEQVVSKVECVASPGAKVACLGASYKADVGDTRESPAMKVIELLQQKGYNVCVVDPHVKSLNGCRLPLSPIEEALDGADCVVLLVDHSEFRRLNGSKLKGRFNGKLIDTRGMWIDVDQSLASEPTFVGSLVSEAVV